MNCTRMIARLGLSGAMAIALPHSTGRAGLPNHHDVERTGGSLKSGHELLFYFGVRLLMRNIAALILLVASARAWGESSSEPEFYSLKSWAPVSTWDYVAIVAGNAATITISAAVNPPTRWQGGILFDDWARDGLRLSSETARNNAGTASTALVVVAGLYPLVVDAGVLTGWIHGRGDLAWQMFILDGEVLTLTGVLTTLSTHVVGRERPSGMNDNVSFFSGHDAIASSAATLICLQHLQLVLFGNKAADATACGIGIAAGVTAADGTGSPFLVYSLKVKPTRADQLAWQLVPVLRSDFLGLSFSGAFQ